MEYLKEAQEALLEHSEAAAATLERGLEIGKAPFKSPIRKFEELPSLKTRMRSNFRGIDRLPKERLASKGDRSNSFTRTAQPDVNKPVPELPPPSPNPKIVPYATWSGARSSPFLGPEHGEDQPDGFPRPLRIRRQATTAAIFVDPFVLASKESQHARNRSSPQPDTSPTDRRNSFSSGGRQSIDEDVPPVPPLPSPTTIAYKAPPRPPPLSLQTTNYHRKPIPPPPLSSRSTFPQTSRTLAHPRGSSTFPSTSSTQASEELRYFPQGALQSSPSPRSSSSGRSDNSTGEPRQRFRSSLHITTQVDDVEPTPPSSAAIEISPSVYNEDDDGRDQVFNPNTLAPPSPMPDMRSRMSKLDWAQDMPHAAPLSSPRQGEEDLAECNYYSDEEAPSTLLPTDDADDDDDLAPPPPVPAKPLSTADLARLDMENKRIPYLHPALRAPGCIERPRPEKTELDALVPGAEVDTDDEIWERVEKVRRKMAWYQANVEAKGKRLLKREERESWGKESKESEKEEGNASEVALEWLRKVGKRERR